MGCSPRPDAAPGVRAGRDGPTQLVSKASKAYLVLYNAAMAFLWGRYLVRIVQAGLGEMARPGGPRFGSIHQLPAAQHLAHIQLLAALDIVHALVGITPSKVAPTVVQIASRCVAVGFGSIPTAGLPGHASTGLAFVAMALAWSLADVARHLFYLQGLLAGHGRATTPLTWARYSLFLVLYPVGAFAEAVQLNSARLQLKATANPWGPALGAVLACYPPGTALPITPSVMAVAVGLFVMYGHMLRQRAKCLLARQ